MKKYEIYQSLWGMEALPTSDDVYTYEEQINWIIQHGFEGILQFYDDSSTESIQQTEEITRMLQECELKFGISCNGFDFEDCKKKINYSKQHSAEFINIMVKSYFVVHEEAIELLKQVINYGEEVGIDVYIETHRASITQDILRTVNYVNQIQEMILTIDLSHYILAGEFTIENLGFYGDLLEEQVQALINRTGSIHLRMSNGEQIQLPQNNISDIHKKWFLDHWKVAVDQGFKRNLNPVPIIVELGLCDYQQRIIRGNEIIYDSNRLEEALIMKRLIEDYL